ncbi:hypothetical protein BMF94_1296 [Rhodotorula taiwanensis]|uniref:CsbD-like domain-containing protein n=1 Tax=Rhodotorula taiwanensis TaxID=741276 RepID=A0A2S5BFZ7_9BASI|nr:hypothetical protein BMF94_1296 [Rhodotorula taiwanensis]
MSSTGTQTGGPAGPDVTTKASEFKPDISTRYANFEDNQPTAGSNPHQVHEKPSGLDKAAGKLEQVTGKVMGDKELQARGLQDQGKVDDAKEIHKLQTEAGGDLSYADRR